VGFGDRLHVLFHFDPLAADFLETGCDHDASFDLFLGRVLDRVCHEAWRHNENSHVHVVRNLQKRGVSLHSLDGLGLGVHRVKNSLVAPVQQVFENRKPQASDTA
jgi:hypothetical protein